MLRPLTNGPSRKWSFWTLPPSFSGLSTESASRHAAARAISDADRILLSSISIWEIGLKVKRQRLFVPVSIQEYADKLESIDRIEILSVDVRTWVKNLELDWDHRDPADRTIVATASLHACPLVTVRRRHPRVLLTNRLVTPGGQILDTDTLTNLYF